MYNNGGKKQMINKQLRKTQTQFSISLMNPQVYLSKSKQLGYESFG